MRRIFAILLLFVMVFAMTSCGVEDGNDAFRVGFGRVEITPRESVPLDSYGDAERRWSEGYITKMYSHCVAMTDADGNTLLLMSTDTSWGDFEEEIAQMISEDTGVPRENIIHCGTHTHSGVATSLSKYPAVARYNETYISAVVEAARLAMEDRTAAQLSSASAETQGLVFVRRFYREDGTLVGDNAGAVDKEGKLNTSPIKEYESQVDGQLQMLRITREGKKDILLTNFQCHPHLHGYTYNASAENWGAFREAVEDALDTYCVAFNGAAGNINSHSRISEDMRTDNFRVWGKHLAEYVEDAWQTMTPVETTQVKAARYVYNGEVNHSEDNKLVRAHQVLAEFQKDYDYEKSALMGFPYGINSGHHASSIIYRSGFPEIQKIEIGAYSIGDISFISVPYEMFDTNGMFIKENSPFDMTFICGYWGAQKLNYIPSELGYQNGGYESDNSLFVPGTGEKLADEYLKLLNQLYQ